MSFPAVPALPASPNLPGMVRSRESIVNHWSRFRLTAHRGLARCLAATIFPPRCCLCGYPGASLDLDLCTVCHADLPWDVFPGDAITALRYEHPVDELIRQLKYQGVIAYARVLGVLLAEAAGAGRRPLPRLLVPVPLHGVRWRERGFNQAAAIARYAGQLLGIPVARHAVRRVRDTPSQTALDVVARRRNVSGAFAVAGERQQRRLLAADHVAVVDDVITTGSTVNEVRAVLRGAGVGQVEVWAVARAE
jgi:ComF family protein